MTNVSACTLCWHVHEPDEICQHAVILSDGVSFTRCLCKGETPVSEDEEKHRAAQESAEKLIEAARKARDDELVEKYRHFQALAFRMLVGDPKQGETFSFDEKEVRHMAEMLLLLDIARGEPVVRFRARYGKYYE